MFETEFPGIVDSHGAAEAHAAVNAEKTAARQRQINQFEEILVPANGNAVFGHAAEPGHDAPIQRLVQVGDLFDGNGS